MGITSYQLHYQFSHPYKKENLFIKMSNLYAIFLFVSFSVLAADAVKCLGVTFSNNDQPTDDDEITCQSNDLTICHYTAKDGDASSLQGKANCIQDESYYYPCVKDGNCYIEASINKPVAEEVYKLCQSGEHQARACKVKKKCLKGEVSDDDTDTEQELTCEADKTICNYTSVTGNTVLTGQIACIQEERFYYPCKSNNDCYIKASDKKPLAKAVVGTCQNAQACKAKKVCLSVGSVACAQDMD